MSAIKNGGNFDLRLLVIDDDKASDLTYPDAVQIAHLGHQIRFDLDILNTYIYDGWKPLHYDLLVVCAAIEYVDRSCRRRATKWSRTFDITIPVQEPVVWQSAAVRRQLSATLRHLTGDDWQFSFIQSRAESVDGYRQRCLPFQSAKEFAIAYSDGLDSRCVSELFENGSDAVRVRVKRHKDHVREGEQPFDLIPFLVKPKASRESSNRSRGFIFAAITAIAAQLSGVSRIVVPESGQGALGPVLVPLHNQHVDYRNYPVFFRNMEKFVDLLLGHRVTYEQPRLWFTKAQTISAYLSQSAKGAQYLFSTRSCWQQRWNVDFNNGMNQCGLCAACLLRRMSMHAAGIDEPESTYLIRDLTASSYADAISHKSEIKPTKSMIEHGSVGARYLQNLAEMAQIPEGSLRPHVFEIANAIGATEQDTHDNLRALLQRHDREWRDFVRSQGEKSFIRGWVFGGRHVG